MEQYTTVDKYLRAGCFDPKVLVNRLQLDPDHSNTHTHLYEHSSPSPFVRSPPPTKPFLANYKLYVYAEVCFPCSFSTVGTLPQPPNAGPTGPPGATGPQGPPGKNGQGYHACIS